MASAIADVHFRMIFHDSMNDQARSHLTAGSRTERTPRTPLPPDEVDKKTKTSASCS